MCEQPPYKGPLKQSKMVTTTVRMTPELRVLLDQVAVQSPRDNPLSREHLVRCLCRKFLEQLHQVVDALPPEQRAPRTAEILTQLKAAFGDEASSV